MLSLACVILTLIPYYVNIVSLVLVLAALYVLARLNGNGNAWRYALYAVTTAMVPVGIAGL